MPCAPMDSSLVKSCNINLEGRNPMAQRLAAIHHAAPCLPSLVPLMLFILPVTLPPALPIGLPITLPAALPVTLPAALPVALPIALPITLPVEVVRLVLVDLVFHLRLCTKTLPWRSLNLRWRRWRSWLASSFWHLLQKFTSIPLQGSCFAVVRSSYFDDPIKFCRGISRWPVPLVGRGTHVPQTCVQTIRHNFWNSKN